jgi:hypothetical protein
VRRSRIAQLARQLLVGVVADPAKTTVAAHGVHELFGKPSRAIWESDHIGHDTGSGSK